ncbi:MAG: hypothetical protein NZ934_04360, partial [Hadesarchaea archaeon]|nr:hypothetical protein [Hadesarchaea archaeon]
MRRRKKSRNKWIAAIVVVAVAVLVACLRSAPAPHQLPAKVEVLSIRLPDSAMVGQPIVASVEVRNSGEASSTYKLALTVDGEIVDVQKVELAGGETKIVEFMLVLREEGAHEIGADGLVRSIIVRAPKPPTFELSNLKIEPSEVEAGGPVTISVEVRNVGEVEGSHVVALKVNGKVVDNKVVVLAGGAVERVSFAVREGNAGKYVVEVGELSGSFVVKPALEPWYEASGTVTAVYDGDTIAVYLTWVHESIAGVYTARTESVRFSGGVDAPELGDPGGYQARDFIVGLCPPGSHVYLDLDNYATGRGPSRDIYGRLLAVIYVKLGNGWVNVN